MKLNLVAVILLLCTSCKNMSSLPQPEPMSQGLECECSPVHSGKFQVFRIYLSKVHGPDAIRVFEWSSIVTYVGSDPTSMIAEVKLLPSGMVYLGLRWLDLFAEVDPSGVVRSYWSQQQFDNLPVPSQQLKIRFKYSTEREMDSFPVLTQP